MKSDYEIFNLLIEDALINFKKEKDIFDENDYRVMSQVFIEMFLKVEKKLVQGSDNLEIEKKKNAIVNLIEAKLYG